MLADPARRVAVTLEAAGRLVAREAEDAAPGVDGLVGGRHAVGVVGSGSASGGEGEHGWVRWMRMRMRARVDVRESWRW